MSLEKIERYIPELEAIKNYDQVKKEKEQLSKKVEELQKDLSNQREKFESLLKKKNESIDRVRRSLRGKKKESEELRETLKKKEEVIREQAEMLRAKSEEVENKEARIARLEEFKATTDGRTLREAEDAFMRAQQQKVEEDSQRLFEEMKARWEREDKPRQVEGEAVKLLSQTIDALRRPEPRVFPKEVAGTGLPQMVGELLSAGVDSRVDAEFERRVEERSQEVALKKLGDLKTVEWPRWYEENIVPRMAQLESGFQINAIKTLRGPCDMRCDRCGTAQSFEVASKEVEDFLRMGYTDILCANPSCVDVPPLDVFHVFAQRHRIRVTLSSLIERRLTADQSASRS